MIGKAGAGLKELRLNGVAVDMPRDELGAAPTAERMLCLEGPPFGVLNAICTAIHKVTVTVG